MRLKKLLLASAVGAALISASAANAETVKIKLEPYVTGLNAPLAMVQPEHHFWIFAI